MEDLQAWKDHYDYLEGVNVSHLIEIGRLKNAWVDGESVEIRLEGLNLDHGSGELYTMMLEPGSTSVKVFRTARESGPCGTEYAFVHLDPAQDFHGWYNVGDQGGITENIWQRKNPEEPVGGKALSKVRTTCHTCGFRASYEWRNQGGDAMDSCQNAKCRAGARWAGGVDQWPGKRKCVKKANAKKASKGEEE